MEPTRFLLDNLLRTQYSEGVVSGNVTGNDTVPTSFAGVSASPSLSIKSVCEKSYPTNSHSRCGARGWRLRLHRFARAERAD
jgi:hypothetical protein